MVVCWGNFGKSFSPEEMEDDLNHLIRDVVGRMSVSSVCMMYDPAYVCGRYRSATLCMTCNMHY